MTKFKILLALSSILYMTLASCSETSELAREDALEELFAFDDNAAYDNLTDDNTLIAEARGHRPGRFSFRTLSAALRCTGLAETVRFAPVTIYAPSDRAFAKLGLDPSNVCEALDQETLTAILLYHVNENKIGLRESGCFSQLNGDIIQVQRPSFRDYLINDTRAYLRFTARRSFIYAIEDVLIPPASNIVETAVAADDFNALVAAVTAADPSIAAALSDEDAVFTVFAPTDQAFSELLGALGLNSLEEAVGALGVEALSQVLLYHVVDGCAVSNALVDGAAVPTLQGENLGIDLGQLSIIDKSGAPSGLIPSLLDIRTSNGVVHAIDKVLLPQAILDAL